MAVDVQALGAGKTCFVISPIGSRLEPIGTPGRNAYERSAKLWENLFSPACAALGLKVVRADKLAESGEITEQICILLRDAEVVIADLTGGNPNVMYELGLRHSKGLVTVQVGEYQQLPFDVAAIRTIQFRNTDAGLIDARELLVATLEADLSGKGRPVTATRIWAELATPAAAAALVDGLARSVGDDDDGDDDVGPGIMDVLAEGEAALVGIGVDIEAAGQALQENTDLAVDAAERLRHSDEAGGGYAGRLVVTRALSEQLSEPVERLEQRTSDFRLHVEQVDLAMEFLLEQFAADPELVESNGEFLTGIIALGTAAAESAAGISQVLLGAREMRKLAKSLNAPGKGIERGLGAYIQGADMIAQWTARAEALLN